MALRMAVEVANAQAEPPPCRPERPEHRRARMVALHAFLVDDPAGSSDERRMIEEANHAKLRLCQITRRIPRDRPKLQGRCADRQNDE